VLYRLLDNINCVEKGKATIVIVIVHITIIVIIAIIVIAGFVFIVVDNYSNIITIIFTIQSSLITNTIINVNVNATIS